MIDYIAGYSYLPLFTFVLQLYVSENMFLIYFKRRDHFYWRFAISSLLFIGLSMILPVIFLYFFEAYFPGVRTLTVMFLSFIAFYSCYKGKFTDILFACTGGVLLQNLAVNMQNMLEYLFGYTWSPLSPFMFLSFFVVYVAGWFVLCMHLKKMKNLSMNRIIALVTALASYLFACVIFTGTNTDATSLDYFYAHLLIFFCDVLSLMMMFGLYRQQSMAVDKAVLEQLLMKSKEQYEISKKNMDVINMKCHDLRYRLDGLNVKDQSDKESIEEIRQAINIYDNIAKTGFPPLDVVLSDRILACEKDSISFTYLVKIEKLSLFSTTDLVALFGNLIDNAIEAERKIEDEKRRVISLKVTNNNAFLGIHIENYTNTKATFQNGLPVSDKGDDTLHGYGSKSVRYIAEKYKGHAVFKQENNLFIVDILIPLVA